MIREEHLEVYELTLTAKAPVFIGSGKSYVKKEYVFLKPNDGRVQSEQVVLMDEKKLFPMLLERGLVDKYERFMLGSETNLYRFLTSECGLKLSDIKAASRYVISASDALDSRHSLKEIYAFVRNAEGRVYVPGSSVKGALRTILLTDMLLREKLPRSEAEKKEKSIPEGKYLHTLKLKTDRYGAAEDDPTNSILRGLSISDSLPIDDSAMMLGGKIDADINGNTHKINLCRECIKPGTKLRFKLTLDQSVLKGRISAESIAAAIRSFDKYYEGTYLSCFRTPRDAAVLSYDNVLLLGGGAGFLSKTLTYPYLGKRDGLRRSIEVFGSSRTAKNHHHEDDEACGISPRSMKYVSYGGKLYPYGLCEVTIT